MDINEFFNKFVANYPLYQTDRGHTVLMDKFRDVFLLDTYETIPEIFKNLYESNVVSSEVYDQILIASGVSDVFLTELTTEEKRIFIKSLADFQKYKSTVILVENVIKAYGDNFEAYELYVDYNVSRQRWECKPYPIYKPSHNDGYNRTIPYSIVYEKVPTLLIHEKQLDNMREQNLAAFPLKTNVVFISSNYNQSITSYIQTLILSVFYKTYYDEMIDVNFSDKSFSVSLYTFLLLWIYVVFNKDINNNVSNSLAGFYINFNPDSISIDIDDLDSILEEYEEIGTKTISSTFELGTQPTTSLDDFYYKYFYPLKSQVESSSQTLDIDSLRNTIKSIDVELINYIDDYLESGKTTVSILIGDLIESIEGYKSTTTDLNFINYFSYFKTFLPTIDFLPSQNTVYKILYYLKPFHTEFLDLEDLSMVFSDDTFNRIYFEMFYQNGLVTTHKDIIELELHPYQLFLDNKFSDIAPISALMGKTLHVPYTNDYQYIDPYLQGLLVPYTIDAGFDDDFFPCLFSLDRGFSEVAPISGVMGSFLNFSYLEDEIFEDDFISLYTPDY